MSFIVHSCTGQNGDKDSAIFSLHLRVGINFQTIPNSTVPNNGNFGLVLNSHINDNLRFLLSYSHDNYDQHEKKSNFLFETYNCQKVALCFGKESTIKNIKIQNDFGLGFSDYRYIKVAYNNLTQEYKTDLVSSNFNPCLTYGLSFNCRKYSNARTKFNIVQRTYYFLTNDNLYITKISNRFSTDVCLEIQFNL